MAAMHCPYCGEEDLRPHAEAPGTGRQSHGAWECRCCARVFALRLLGLATTTLEVRR